ncbi:MAG: NADH:ubiquinone reductase (Na(+)-transporting) subunit A, partial [Flavobacteriia bacterium]|nr:NADH:ubiquinone reductase (Na(+)-transporting) subunit A [Flavobacteriia bacterium]
MSRLVSIHKGLDIRLQGLAEKQLKILPNSRIICISPLDFHGLNPKLLVKEGDSVKIGDPLFFDKTNEALHFVTPASGTVKSIIRGEKRKILQVLIETNENQEYINGAAEDVSKLSPKELKTKMLACGLWPFIKQRPIDVIADQNQEPKAIFVSAFDSSPLAPDYNFILEGREEDLQTGFNALCQLTKGKVHLNIDSKNDSALFSNIKGVEINKFAGKHPAGNVGTQIHHIDPINKGEFIWTINIQDLVIIGNYFNTGKLNARRTIALSGSEVSEPQYYNVLIGSNLDGILKGKVKGNHVRFISGNVLTGDQKQQNDYLGYYHNQITVIPEGDNYKFFLTKGWLGLGFDKFSNSRLFPTFLL